MPRYKITTAYDGTGYAGWQRQEEQRTVAGTLGQGKNFKNIFGSTEFDVLLLEESFNIKGQMRIIPLNSGGYIWHCALQAYQWGDYEY